MGVKKWSKMSKFGIEKNRRFVIFRVTFYRFWPLLVPIRIYRKTGPTKSTVLGPGPPPGKIYKIYRKSWFFLKNGPSIEPEKASVKSASTPYPPSKVNFIRFLINLLPNFVPLPFIWSLPNFGIGYFRFFGPGHFFTLWKTRQFFFLLALSFVHVFVFLTVHCLVQLRVQKENRPSAPKKGRLKAQSQAIVHYRNHDGYNLSLPNLSTADRGPTAPYRHRPRIQAQYKTPHHRQHLCQLLSYHYPLVHHLLHFITTQFHPYTFF
jgi:hypothetical protein